jgi:hypothetical protein
MRTKRFTNTDLERSRHFIQNNWSEDERSRRRRIAERRQRALLRLLMSSPVAHRAERAPAA